MKEQAVQAPLPTLTHKNNHLLITVSSITIKSYALQSKQNVSFGLTIIQDKQVLVQMQKQQYRQSIDGVLIFQDVKFLADLEKLMERDDDGKCRKCQKQIGQAQIITQQQIEKFEQQPYQTATKNVKISQNFAINFKVQVLNNQIYEQKTTMPSTDQQSQKLFLQDSLADCQKYQMNINQSNQKQDESQTSDPERSFELKNLLSIKKTKSYITDQNGNLIQSPLQVPKKQIRIAGFKLIELVLIFFGAVFTTYFVYCAITSKSRRKIS